MPDIWNTNLRLNLEKENHKKAYEYLCAMDRKKFKSYNQVIADALVEYFERYYKQEDDPYFETREKEDAFIARVLDAVRHSAPSLPASQEAEAAEQDENVAAMFAFLDGFE